MNTGGIFLIALAIAVGTLQATGKLQPAITALFDTTAKPTFLQWGIAAGIGGIAISMTPPKAQPLLVIVILLVAYLGGEQIVKPMDPYSGGAVKVQP